MRLCALFPSSTVGFHAEWPLFSKHGQGLRQALTVLFYRNFSPHKTVYDENVSISLRIYKARYHVQVVSNKNEVIAGTGYMTFHSVSTGVKASFTHGLTQPPINQQRFETCRRHEKLNINFDNCALRLFALYNYITTHGTKKHKIPCIYRHT